MRHRIKTKILQRKKAPREALLNTMATSLVLYEKIKTTEAKAKALRPFIERLITESKKNSLNAKKYLSKYVKDKKAVKKMMEVYSPLFKDRKGGYVRIIKLGVRKGDNAKMAQIEFVK